MKYKTLFRLGLKLIGILFFISGSGPCLAQAAWLIENPTPGPPELSRLVYLLAAFVYPATGLYLFFGGKWIANKAIPSNRPYCQECAYDLTSATENRCPECGTRFRRQDVNPPQQDDDPTTENDT